MGVHRYVVGSPVSLGRAALRAPYELAAHRYRARCERLISSLLTAHTNTLRRCYATSMSLLLMLTTDNTLAPNLG